MPDAESVEVAIRPDATLETACMSAIRKTIQLGSLSLGKPSFTRHPKWGDIVRMDVGVPTPDRYSRILCTRYRGQQTVQVSMYDRSKGVCDGHGLVIVFPENPKPKPEPVIPA